MGSASPDVRLRIRGIAVTVSVRFCGGGFDSFLGFEYGVVITLASHVFEYFFRFFLRACVICAFFLALLGSHGVTPPPFWPTSRFPHVRFLGFFGVLRATVALASLATTITAPILLLALRSAALLAVFFRISRFSRWFRIILGIFAFIPGLPFWCCLLCSACLFSSLSPLVTSLGGLGCSPPSLVVPVVFALGEFYFCSSGAVSSSSSCSG